MEAIADGLTKLGNPEREQLKQLFENFLLRMVEEEASDIDLGGQGSLGQIWLRIYNNKRPVFDLEAYSLDQINILNLNILTPQQQKFLFDKRNLDFSYAVSYKSESARFRGDMYFDLDHLALNMRRINNSILPFKNLGFHPHVAKALSLKHEKQGLILVTGITGSGKSATLDSIIDANNNTVDAHIVIISSPVECVHISNRCIIRHREVGRDVMSFKDGAIQALRQDPDIIMIGEMRDSDTIMTALEITDSGHKVFSTLHTGSAVESIDRIVGEMPTSEQERVRIRLADVLKVVISQKLVPTIDGRRILAKEILIVNSSVKAAIKNDNAGEIYQMISENGKEGMNTMEQDLRRLVVEKRISLEEAIDHANNKNRMRELLEYAD
ncbi:twitching motility protein PilT [candidate division LCP-89 bacterium B3_LCP]|uniref:Twitching motility protein PilT n=1 Tax=candidate division LCP-89 bacterium B3_LCP TaxID=2012998 RepID=A0A532UYN8_UNCL8|nr:MAG: twitching motility protein PilT [candidate division LCP-89 bacterium B3_LCP]